MAGDVAALGGLLHQLLTGALPQGRLGALPDAALHLGGVLAGDRVAIQVELDAGTRAQVHMAAATQISRDNPGRAYYLGKIEEGKSTKEARRALKRKISDAVFRQLRDDARPQT